MTIDLKINKGRVNHSIRGVTDAGAKWVKETFDFSFMGTTMFSGDAIDIADIINKAESAGLTVEER
jgi:hypothetical protein